MSQKRKTTGLPPSTRRSSEGRKYRSRSEREAQINRVVLLVTAVISVIVLVILGFALLLDQVIRPNQVVASVGGTNITVKQFQKRATYQRWRYGVLLSQVPSQYQADIFTNPQGPYAQFADAYHKMSDSVLLGKSVLDDMSEEILLQQYAQANGITVDQSDIDKQINNFFSYEPNPQTSTPTQTPSTTPTPLLTDTPTSTPTVTPTEAQTSTPTITPYPTGIPTATPGPTQQFTDFQDNQKTFYDDALTKTGMSQDEIRQIFTADALRQKIMDKITANVDVNDQEEQIQTRHILVDDENQANDILAALKNGESFAALAKALSKDSNSASQGGELGWKGRGAYVQEFEDAIWSDKVKVGDVLGPIKSQYGYHIIQVEGHAVRPVSDSDMQTAKSNAFDKFLTDLKTKTPPQYFDYVDYVPESPSLSDFGIQEGLTPNSSGAPGDTSGLLPGDLSGAGGPGPGPGQ